jgi:predicted RND superfamily exporter protein
VRPAEINAPRFTEAWVLRLLSLVRAAGPRRVLAAAAVLTVAALVLTTLRLRIEDNWIDNLPPASETVRGDRAINRTLAGTNTLELMFDSGQPEGFLDPSVLAAVGAIEDELAASSQVGAVQSAYGDVVRVEAALAGRNYREFRAAIRSGSQRLTRPEIEQALLLLESTGNAPGMDRLEDRYQRTRMTIFVRGANYSRMGEVLALSGRAARERLPTAKMTPFGDGWVGHLSIELLVEGQMASIGLAVLADTLLLVLLFRSLSIAVLAIVPVLMSVLLVFAALAAAGMPLGTANSMFAAIALGLGVDYSIHLVASYREKVRRQLPPGEAIAAAHAGTGPAILISTTAIVGGFSVLAFSVVPPNRQLGILICLSLAVCAAVTLVLLPALLLVYEGARSGRGPSPGESPRPPTALR